MGVTDNEYTIFVIVSGVCCFFSFLFSALTILSFFIPKEYEANTRWKWDQPILNLIFHLAIMDLLMSIAYSLNGPALGETGCKMQSALIIYSSLASFTMSDCIGYWLYSAVRDLGSPRNIDEERTTANYFIAFSYALPLGSLLYVAFADLWGSSTHFAFNECWLKRAALESSDYTMYSLLAGKAIEWFSIIFVTVVYIRMMMLVSLMQRGGSDIAVPHYCEDPSGALPAVDYTLDYSGCIVFDGILDERERIDDSHAVLQLDLKQYQHGSPCLDTDVENADLDSSFTVPPRHEQVQQQSPFNRGHGSPHGKPNFSLSMTTKSQDAMRVGSMQTNSYHVLNKSKDPSPVLSRTDKTDSEVGAGPRANDLGGFSPVSTLTLAIQPLVHTYPNPYIPPSDQSGAPYIDRTPPLHRQHMVDPTSKHLSRGLRMRMTYIPIAFVLLRIPTLIRSVMMFLHPGDTADDFGFSLVQAVTTPSQGMANGICFVLMKKSVRVALWKYLCSLLSSLCCCCGFRVCLSNPPSTESTSTSTLSASYGAVVSA